MLVQSQIINYQGIYETMEGATIQIITNPNQNPLLINIAGNTQLTAIFAKEQYQFCYSCINGYGNTDYSG